MKDETDEYSINAADGNSKVSMHYRNYLRLNEYLPKLETNNITPKVFSAVSTAFRE